MTDETSQPPIDIKAGFLDDLIMLPVEKILSTKTISASLKRSAKFKTILASIREVGVIEPPVVAPNGKARNEYILLDGHLRIEALKTLEEKEVLCLVSTDDESFTYNKHYSRLAAVQEHTMILHGIKCGVPEEKLAAALNVDVGNIKRKRDLLNGICPDAADLLKDKMVSASVFPLLRKMKDVRQLEAASMMVEANLYSAKFAKSILMATPRELLADPEKARPPKGYSQELLASMEREREMLDREYRLVVETYDRDVFNLILAQGWLAKITKNERVKKYLSQNQSDIYAQFLKIIGISSLVPKEAT